MLFSCKGDDWATPKFIYDDYMNRGFFDPCPLEPDFDGLSVDWGEKAFVNPPYSQVRKWLEKAISEVNKGNCKLAVFLVFARVDTRWFHDLVYHKYDYVFLKGRLKFGDSKQGAPAPSMLIWIKGCSY